MPLRKERPAPPPVDERLVDRLIEKGGSAAREKTRRARTSNFPFRYLRPETAERVQAAMARRPVKPSENAWINEAIIEKLEREEAALHKRGGES